MLDDDDKTIAITVMAILAMIGIDWRLLRAQIGLTHILEEVSDAEEYGIAIEWQ